MFDGANHTIFNSNPNNTNWISNSDIKKITEDRDGNLLVAASDGVLLKSNRNSDTFTVTSQQNIFEGSDLIGLITSKQGSTWILTSSELFLWNPRFRQTPAWLENADIVSLIGTPNTISEDDAGNILVGGDLGLAIFFLQKKMIATFDLESLGLPKYSRITALDSNIDGTIYLGTSTGTLISLDINTGSVLARLDVAKFGPTFISTLLRRHDFLIIATDRGLYSSDGKLSFIEDLGDKGDELSNPDIYSLYEDGKHIWIGTGDGLDIMSFAAFELFNRKNSGVYDDILAFEEDVEGRIWIGTYTGLYRYDDATHRHIKIDVRSDTSGLVDQRVTTIFARKNQLWIGYIHGGVKIVDIKTGKSHSLTLSPINDLAVTKILGSENNQDVWIATYDGGLFRISDEGTRAYFENHSLQEKSITALFLSRSNILLAISDNKVYQYHSQTDSFDQVNFRFGEGDSKPTIYSFSQNGDDDILIGTKGHGAFRWTRKSQLSQDNYLHPLEKEGALSASIIYGMEVDSEDNLWCSTQSGIIKLDSKGNFVKKFTTIDGLQGNDFNLGAAFTSQNGLVYFGGVNGYNRFDPSEVEIDRSASPMRLTGIRLPRKNNRNIRDVANITSLQLTHEDQFVTFQFSVLDFSHPERNQFRYKLENFDSEWIENDSRNTATYTNLPAGEYVFRVQGANSAGIWNRDGITLEVYVLPAPWFSWWALCIYGATILFIGWCGLRIFRSYAIDRKSAQMATDMFEAENRADDDMQEQLEIQDELVQTAYQHNLATLSLVGDCISYQAANQPNETRQDLVTGSIKRIAALSRLEDCLYYQVGGPVANLHKFTEIIVPILLQKSPVNPETIVTINEILPRLLPAELASPLALVLYELLENCILHAFEKDSPANYIHAKMGFSEDSEENSRSIWISVSDSGIGLSDQVDNLANENSGFAVVQEIVNNLGGTLKFSNGTGTTVSLSIPELDDT